MIINITYDIDKIKLKSDKGQITSIVILLITLTVIYIIWWSDIISDTAKYNISGDDKHLLWILMASIVYFIPLLLLIRLTTKLLGDLQITFKNQFIQIDFMLFSYSFSKKYELDKITKLRIIDKGSFIFQVGFNYGEGEKFIALGLGSNQKIANNLYNKLESFTKK